MSRTATIIWFLKVSIVCAAMLAFCWVTPHFVEDIPDFPSTTTDEVQSKIIERYLGLPVATVTLTGSSFTMRLREEFFHDLYVRNLALPGGSPLTGAAIINAGPVRPRFIAVETNILSRGIDQAMVEKVWRKNRPSTHNRSNLRPFRALAALYQRSLDNRLRFDRDDKIATIQEVNFEQAILQSPPASKNDDLLLTAIVAEWNNPDHDQIIRKNAAELKSIVETLEMENISVFFYEVPLGPAFAQSRYMKMGRSAMAELFGPDNGRWLSLDYTADELRWTDGAHLDERSAILVARSLERAIEQKIGRE